MIDFDGEACVNQESYSKDKCSEDNLRQHSMASLGCTTPWNGIDKTSICTDADKGKEAIKLYKMAFGVANNNCSSSCQYITTRVIKTDNQLQPLVNGKGIGFMKIISRENIKLTRATYMYTTLELIAEIGGYVGLFLGVSIIQVNALFDKIFDFICKKALH